MTEKFQEALRNRIFDLHLNKLEHDNFLPKSGRDRYLLLAVIAFIIDCLTWPLFKVMPLTVVTLFILIIIEIRLCFAWSRKTAKLGSLQEKAATLAESQTQEIIEQQALLTATELNLLKTLLALGTKPRESHTLDTIAVAGANSPHLAETAFFRDLCKERLSNWQKLRSRF